MKNKISILLKNSLTIINLIALSACASNPSLYSNAYADETSVLKAGQPAPFDGLLFTEEKAEQLRKDVIAKKTLEDLNLSLNQSLEREKANYNLSESKSNALIEQNIKLSKSLQEERSMTSLERIFWFGLGSVLTGAAAYGVVKTLK